VIITDKLQSYDAAKIEMGLIARHKQDLRKNNRAENSHQPVRRREFKGSSRPDQPSAFYRYMPPSTTTSTSNAASPPAPRSVFSEAQPLRLGEERLRPNQKISS
jgi:transposase-like protein